MKLPFVSRRSYDAQRCRAERFADQLADTRAERDAFKTAAVTAAEQFTDASIVNDCLTRRVEQMQAQLDDALGLNHPAVVAGQHWQDRRVDKPHPAKEPS